VKHRSRIVAAAAFVMVLAACGDDDPVPVAVEESPFASASSSPAAEPTGSLPEESPAEPEGETGLEVWFHDGERVAVAYRAVPATRAPGRAAMEQLLAGPTSEEAAEGMGTQAPEGTRLLGLSITDGIATVDLSRDFESGGGAVSMSMRLAQVVYTLTQFDTVHGVLFDIEGEHVESFGGEGVDTSEPLQRSDFADYAPPIVVTAPRPGARVSPGAEVRGDADVFEATVSLRVLDADGNELLDTFTTATCGSGCRGTYAKRLRFAIQTEQDGVIEVYSASAEDGSPQHVVRLPVRLVP
jgi:germination protein M